MHCEVDITATKTDITRQIVIKLWHSKLAVRFLILLCHIWRFLTFQFPIFHNLDCLRDCKDDLQFVLMYPLRNLVFLKNNIYRNYRINFALWNQQQKVDSLLKSPQGKTFEVQGVCGIRFFKSELECFFFNRTFLERFSHPFRSPCIICIWNMSIKSTNYKIISVRLICQGLHKSFSLFPVIIKWSTFYKQCFVLWCQPIFKVSAATSTKQFKRSRVIAGKSWQGFF